VWRQDTNRAAGPRAKLSRRALRWALEGRVVQHLTVARFAEALAVSWHTANGAFLLTCSLGMQLPATGLRDNCASRRVHADSAMFVGALLLQA
jgi:hypothetical protein